MNPRRRLNAGAAGSAASESRANRKAPPHRPCSTEQRPCCPLAASTIALAPSKLTCAVPRSLMLSQTLACWTFRRPPPTARRPQQVALAATIASARAVEVRSLPRALPPRMDRCRLPPDYTAPRCSSCDEDQRLIVRTGARGRSSRRQNSAAAGLSPPSFDYIFPSSAAPARDRLPCLRSPRPQCPLAAWITSARRNRIARATARTSFTRNPLTAQFSRPNARKPDRNRGGLRPS